MLLQSVTALLRVPARSNANTVSVALGDEENIASLHLHNGSGFAVFASAIDSPAATITHRENTVVVNFAERIEIVNHGKSKLFEFALVDSTLTRTLEGVTREEHILHVVKFIIFDLATFDVAAVAVVYFVIQPRRAFFCVAASALHFQQIYHLFGILLALLDGTEIIIAASFHCNLPPMICFDARIYF